MSDEFGTVNMRRGAPSREIEVLRKHYRQHRESLVAMAAEAPTEHLAAEYQRLIRDIDGSMAKLDELEGRVPPDTQPVIRTEPGARPLVTGPAVDPPPAGARPAAASRLVLIVLAGLVVLGIIGWLMWRASSDRRAQRAERQPAETAPITETVVPVTPAPAPVAAALTIQPAAQDYGTIRKGTRAVRQFQVTNNTAEPMSIEVARSACRCLYYSYAKSLAPKKVETITVTVDAARAKAGELQESLAITSKSNPDVSGTIGITAMVK